jgi:phospholipid transport system substrate-binding protein
VRVACAAGNGREVSFAPMGPMEELRRTESALEATLRRHVPDWSPEADATRIRVGTLLSSMLDYERMARSVLASEWDKLSDERRRAFLDRFTLLTNQTFTAALIRSESRVRFEGETVFGPNATVAASVVSGKPGPPRPAERMEYRLSERDGRWLVYDVVIDGVSLIDSYRAQFSSLMRRGGFDEIMYRMQRKLEASRPP